MDDLSIPQNFVTEVAVKAVACQQVDQPPEDAGEFVTHPLQGNQANACVRGQINQYVDVGCEIITYRQTEHRQLAYGMRTAKIADGSLRKTDLRIHNVQYGYEASSIRCKAILARLASCAGTLI